MGLLPSFQTHASVSDLSPVQVNAITYGIGIGRIPITVVGDEDSRYKVNLEQVIHVPNMEMNLLSTEVLLRKGPDVLMHHKHGVCVLKGNKVIAKTTRYGSIRRLTLPDEPYAYEAKRKSAE